MSNELHAAAEGYRVGGLRPIPCQPRGKSSLAAWRPFQERAPSELDVARWWKDWPEANIALILGRGLFVVDLDGAGAEDLLREKGIELPADAPRVKTGNGQHVYLSATGGVRNRAALLSRSGKKPQVDIRGDGGYVLAPPSVHLDGQTYEWLTPLTFPVPPAPARLLDLLASPGRGKEQPEEPLVGTGWVATALRGMPEGARDDTCARLAGYFIGKGLPDEVTREILRVFADRCDPPLTMRDVDRVLTSIDRAQARMEAREKAEKQVTVEHVSVAVLEALRRVESGGRATTGTPFPTLTALLDGGFSAGELIYLGARPGVGKTAFALEMARLVGHHDKRVLIISREMVTEALARRMLSQEGRIDASDLKLGRANATQLAEAAQELSSLPLWLTDSAISVEQINEAIDSVAGGVHMLVVDYLQLVRAPKEVRDRRLQVEWVSQGLKAIALARQIPVLCLSSLARPPEAKGRPTLSSLRESGELEHDADVVLFLHRENDVTECIVAKNRDGRQGIVRLTFNPAFVSFGELAEDCRFQGGVEV